MRKTPLSVVWQHFDRKEKWFKTGLISAYNLVISRVVLTPRKLATYKGGGQVRRRIVSSIVSFALSLSLLTAMSVITAPPANALTTGTGSGLFALIKMVSVTTQPFPQI